MKTLSGTKPRKVRSGILSLLTPGILLAATCWAAPVDGDRTTTNTTVPVSQTKPRPAGNQPSTTTPTPGVSDILKMADAGVSMEVIKTYVDCSATPFQPTEQDVIALKQHKVSDDVVTLLLKRGAEARAVVAQAKKDAAVRLLSTHRAASGGFDPESYDFFQHYYLQPRALASAYQRLAPYSYPTFAYPYRYGSAYSFGAPFYGRSFFPGQPYHLHR